MNELGGEQSLALGGERATTQFTVVIFAGSVFFYFLADWPSRWPTVRLSACPSVRLSGCPVIFLTSPLFLTKWNATARGSAIFSLETAKEIRIEAEWEEEMVFWDISWV